MLLMAMPAIFSSWQEVRRDPLFMLCLAFLLYLVAWTLWCDYWGPFPDTDVWNESLKWLVRGFLAIWLVSFWLTQELSPPKFAFMQKTTCSANRALRRINYVLILALVGFWIRIARHVDMDQVWAIVQGRERAAFGNSAITFGVWSAIAALGLALHFHRIGNLQRRFLFYGGCFFLSLAIALHLLGMLYSLSRANWLAGLLVIPLTLALFAVKTDRLNRSVFVKGGLVGIFLLAAAVVPAKDIFMNRLMEERETLKIILNGDSDVPSTSWGYRISMCRIFAEHWLERPFLGWGPGASEQLLSRYGGLTNFEHFHNSFFEILIQLGLCGFIFYLLLFYVLFKASRRGYRLARLPLDTALFLGAGFVFSAIVAVTDDLLGSRHGAFVLTLAGGIVYAAGKPIRGTGLRFNSERQEC